ncbi:pilus assembly protein [Janthinobacterium fluminis]|uniref:PilC/PilY family type IV pilus protein n=1 Tax=Janthinobacterium fluminis TaxID=2987524 RepID=A0ABT5K6C9_9BURK|nr:PilC/PilY family type IV pilus protein [Janthinobacterium fluminis]MDC8760568.1 PilC/PilY family type IV pilus protein [Janthinobacterium fluminis]
MRALAVLLLAAVPALAAPPLVDIADMPLAVAGGRVPPNLLLNFALDYTAAAAAYPGAADYDGKRDYLGYFNAAMCYGYPLRRRAGALEPDQSEAKGYFSILKRADDKHECGGDAFSGNFMNWASASVLDIVRYGLSGGDRVIDTPGLTVLQRAYLPDGKVNPDFYAHPAYFPRKTLGGGAARRVTPFDAPVLYIVSCRNRILFSDAAVGGACDAPRGAGRSDRDFGAYLARVKVCDAAEGPLRPDLCVRYGTSYKPSGSVQRYAGKLRIGLFGYLSEYGAGEPNVYGGALRVALDQVGASRADPPAFEAGANPRAEWRDDNGVLVAAPGGLLDYINRLGRSAPSRRGVYKGAAPLGEMYYEALRYLQGRQASAGAPAPASDDGLAVSKHWRDPLTAACQRNVIVTLANAGAAGDRYIPGNARTQDLDAARSADAFANAAPLDVMEWTRRVGDMEADPAGVHGNQAPRPHLRNLDALDTGEAGRGSYYLAGLAYWARTTPIRPDQSGRVDNYVIDLDRGGNGAVDDSNPRATRPRDSQLYLAAKYGGFDDWNGDGNPFRTTRDDSDQAAAGNAEWRGMGRDPKHYFLGSDPPALVAAIRAAFAAAASPGRLAGLPLAVAPAAGEGAYLLQPGFDGSDWGGSLGRWQLDVSGDAEVGIGRRLWDAGAILSGNAGVAPPRAAQPAPERRHIYTSNIAGRTPSTISFEWSQLADTQRALLDVPPGGVVADGLGEQRLQYLRGERGREVGRPGGIFRRRDRVLGDTVHGAPVLVGAPSSRVAGPAYGAFHARYQARRKTVYLGANDGMLHAFDVGSGAELFAYVPNALIGALSALPDTGYAHRPYVDGGVAAGEALLQGQWRTVLVAGMGGGAQGAFALDVTDPERFSAGGALWEFSDADDAAMGNVLAPPAIAKFSVAIKDGVPEYRYFAVLASGFNNYADDGKARFARNAAGALFLLALDKPAAAPWRLGVNYYKLAIPLTEPAAANALGPPALVVGADGAVRYAYAGDLQGNVWRIDFSGAAPWPGAVGGQPVFVARDGSGLRQAITQRPQVVFAPGGGYLLLFGTGMLSGEGDLAPSAFRPQSFYAVRDDVDAPPRASGRAALAPRVLDGADADAAGRTLRGDAVRYSGAGAAQGWYFDFPRHQSSGERSVSTAVLAAGRIFFNTVLPGSEACAAPGVRSYAVDSVSGFAVGADGVARSGVLTGQFIEGEIRGPPLLLQMAARAGSRDATGRALVDSPYVVLQAGANRRTGKRIALAAAAKRLGWREVANWRDLHEAAKQGGTALPGGR